MKSWMAGAAAAAMMMSGSAAVHAQAPAAPPANRPASADTTAADAAFKALYTREWAWRQAEGLESGEDDHKIEAHEPHVDPASQQRRLAYWTDIMARLKAVDPQRLSPEQQVNFAVYRDQIQVLINSQRFRDWEKPLTADTSFWGEAASPAREPFKSLDDYKNFIAQMRDLPRYFDEETANMRAGLKRGFTPPKVTLVGRDASITSVTDAKSPEDTIFFKPFKQFPASVPAAQQAQLRAEAAEVIRTQVMPAYAKLLAFYRTDYAPHARVELGASSLPDGPAYYQSKIKEFTTLDMTPDQIHQLGLSEMAKIHAEMLAAMKQSGFKGDFPAFLQFLRTDPQFYAKTPDELMMRTAWVAKQFDGKASQYFGYLPRERFAIIEVPPDQAPFYTSGRGGPGVYLVNTYNLPSRPLYSMPALTLHESAPGHAFQMPISLEHKGQPEFRSRSYISAYGEGWALYCERLGVEMGMYHTPYETFGMLSYQAWRAARLVVDTGLHAKGWTREQAQKYLHDNTALSDHEIETETDRYISWPAQALSYYIGEDTIWRARRKAEAALGERFNIRAFHDTVLELGSVPMPVLEARIDRFIAEGGKGPYPEMEK